MTGKRVMDGASDRLGLVEEMGESKSEIRGSFAALRMAEFLWWIAGEQATATATAKATAGTAGMKVFMFPPMTTKVRGLGQSSVWV